jgi:hypothetical protein
MHPPFVITILTGIKFHGLSLNRQMVRLPYARGNGRVQSAFSPRRGKEAAVDGLYLRIIVHANEHMGQLVAYARMTGVAPPWAKQ